MNIYVAYLATDGGRDAIALGVQLARTAGAKLVIGMVIPPNRAAALTGGDFTREVLGRQADKWLTTARTYVPGDTPVITDVGIHHSIAQGIVTQAERAEATTIVVGATGGGLLGRHSLGPVVNELIHSAPTALALAPRGHRHLPVSRVRSITCDVGSHPSADPVLEAGVSTCARAAIPLRLASLVALDPAPVDQQTTVGVMQQVECYAEAMLATARARLSTEVEVTSTVAVGMSVEKAVQELDWHPGDVMMIGSSRLAAPHQFFLGSRAAKILRVVEVPIVIIPREVVDEP